MSYIVWCNNYTDGWSRSDDLETLEDCYRHVVDFAARDFIITKPVEVVMSEAAERLSGNLASGAEFNA